MLTALPDDIDKSENQIPWDYTRPAAQDTVELLLQDGIAILERYTFGASNGAGQAASLADALTESPSAYFSFELLAESSLPLATVIGGAIGTNITIQAVEGGTIGNVPPDAVMLMVKLENGISHITNGQATSGGASGLSAFLSSMRTGYGLTSKYSMRYTTT